MASQPQPTMTPEIAAGARDNMVMDLEREMETTAKVIAAIPEKQARTYRPDPKARTAWELAWHLVSSEVQMLEEIADMKFTMDPRFPEEPKTVADMVTWYKRYLPPALARVRKLTPQQLLTPVDFYGAFNFPDFVYISFVSKHSIHHRGQLSVHLRPLGGKVPSIYGGSADEPWQG
jgi:uncharacterized damage-inducible protein DinB